jgi:hypothetical protein
MNGKKQKNYYKTIMKPLKQEDLKELTEKVLRFN